MARRIIDEHDRLLSLMAVVAIAVGACLDVTGLERAGDGILAISVALLLVSLILHVAHALVVERRLGVRRAFTRSP